MHFAILLVVCFEVTRLPGFDDMPWQPDQQVCFSTGVFDDVRYLSFRECVSVKARYRADSYRHRELVRRAALTVQRIPDQIFYTCQQRFEVF